jgi:acyl-CoA synthetase (AMP-forming)/AMP-acid ligase II
VRLDHDLVPADLRVDWRARGWCPGRDLFTLFEEQAALDPDKIAVLDDDGATTFGQLTRQARRVANHLAGLGIGSDDVVALQTTNRAATCALDLAIAATGAICLAFPVQNRGREVQRLLAQSGATAAIVEQHHGGGDPAGEVLAMRGVLPRLRHVITLGEPVPGCGYLDPVLDGCTGDPGDTGPGAAIDAGRPARIFVTSGTEGEPKLVLFSHDALAGGIGAFIYGLGVHGASRVLVLPPLASGFGAQGTAAILAQLGATLVVTATFSADAALTAIERHRPTVVTAVPTMVHMLLADPSFDRRDLSSLEVVCTSGAPLAPLVARELTARTGATFVAGYGCSDGALCQTALDAPIEEVTGTVGRPRPEMCSIRVLRADGEDAATGEIGEICGRGPMSPLGYFDPDLDARYRFDGGWARTGDLGYLDDRGLLHVVDRVKDIIIRGGLNISPAEVDALLVEHPAVLEASCVGIPHDRLGEQLCAAVVLRPGTTTPGLHEIITFLRQRGLARSKLPEHLVVIDGIPRNPVGKPLRRLVREQVLTRARQPIEP